MREITPVNPLLSEQHAEHNVVRKGAPIPVDSYVALVKQVASLAYLNKDSLLFYRGQDKDYRNKASTSVYPSIYRKDVLTAREIRDRFETLEACSRKLAEKFAERQMEGKSDVRRKAQVAWDSAALRRVRNTAFGPHPVPARGLPLPSWTTRKSAASWPCLGCPTSPIAITFNSEHDLVIVRLLSICPPLAVRPYFQDGYQAGTMDVTRNTPTSPNWISTTGCSANLPS